VNQQGIEDLGRIWIQRLGLQNWDIQFIWGDELYKYWADVGLRDDLHASCWRAKSYDEAKIYVNPDEFEKWTDRDAAVNIVHELLHLVLRDVEFVIDHIEGFLHRDVDRAVSETFHHHVEGAIERLANRFVDLAEIEDGRY
jgi:hypothetical protein